MIKRYRLLKDLPTFNAGDIFILKDDGCLYWSERYQEDAGHEYSCYGHWKSEVMAYHKYTLAHFPNILKDWFERDEIYQDEKECSTQRMREILESLKDEIDNYLEENW